MAQIHGALLEANHGLQKKPRNYVRACRTRFSPLHYPLIRITIFFFFSLSSSSRGIYSLGGSGRVRTYPMSVYYVGAPFEIDASLDRLHS